MNKEIPKLIDFPRHLDVRGNLSVIEQAEVIPFNFCRAYWIYNVPGGERRGGHAYKRNREIIIALSGSFDVTVDCGEEVFRFSLNRSYYGLYVPAGTWRELSNFSTNAVALIIASEPYSEDDYLRTYPEFLAYSGSDEAVYVPGPHKQLKAFLPINDLEVHHSERRGDLCVIGPGSIPEFSLERVFYLYDVPAGQSRGAHAHRETWEVIVAASGSFRVTVTDINGTREHYLNNPGKCLIVRPYQWVDLAEFSGGAIALVACNGPYNNEEYIRDSEQFFKELTERNL
ncbi:MAG: WxcM-like domain-containing protein [Muribaculaceae bacterium]|nr:WxcM-like domain-containing protein [Muribaculaceae bacterium]